MKYIIFFIMAFPLFSSQWQVKNISLLTENDADFRTDRDYTYGSEIGILYQIKKNEYYSFSIAHQMYTPSDIEADNIDFTKEKPYAGYMYIGGGYHKVNDDTLDSYNIQIGFVGPSVKMDEVQKMIHSIIGSPEPKGWDEQIGDELILQFNYEKRFITSLSDLGSFSQDMIYYGGVNIGNASTKLSFGGTYIFGNFQCDNFGIDKIDYRGYNVIPRDEDLLQKRHLYNFFLTFEANIVARDIFLDGNTFKDSVNVDKEVFVLKGGFGISYRYEHFLLAYLHTFSSKEFKTQDYYHGYGSFYIGYNF